MRPISSLLLVLALLPLICAFSCKSGWEIKGGVGSSSIDTCPTKYCLTTTIEDKTKGTKVETTKWACAQQNQCKTAGCRKEEKNGVKTKSCCCVGDKCNDVLPITTKGHSRVARRAPSKTTVSRKGTTPRPWFLTSTTKATPNRNPGTKANTVGTKATSPRPVYTLTTKAKPFPINKVTKAQSPATTRSQPWFTTSRKVTSRPVFSITTKSKPFHAGNKDTQRSVVTQKPQPEGAAKLRTKLAAASKQSVFKRSDNFLVVLRCLFYDSVFCSSS